MSITEIASPIRTLSFPLKLWRSKMKTLIAALVLLSLAAVPTFAAPYEFNRGSIMIAPGVQQSPNLGSTSREGQVRAF
jgi:hypothetical protein